MPCAMWRGMSCGAKQFRLAVETYALLVAWEEEKIITNAREFPPSRSVLALKKFHVEIPEGASGRRKVVVSRCYYELKVNLPILLLAITTGTSFAPDICKKSKHEVRQ